MLPQYQTTSIFLGLFLRKLEIQDYQNFADSLPWRLPELDAEPQVNRVPANAPPDVPRVRFGSKDGRLFIEVFPSRIHFRMLPGEVTQAPQGGATIQALPSAQAFDVFRPAALRIHTALSEHYGATASRIGVVADYISQVPSSANQRIQKSILGGKNLFGDRLQEAQVVAATRIVLGGGLNANRRIMVRSARTNQEGNPDLILNVNVDINTLAEEPYDVSTSDLDTFLTSVSDHLETSVPLMNEKALFE